MAKKTIKNKRIGNQISHKDISLLQDDKTKKYILKNKATYKKYSVKCAIIFING